MLSLSPYEVKRGPWLLACFQPQKNLLHVVQANRQAKKLVHYKKESLERKKKVAQPANTSRHSC